MRFTMPSWVLVPAIALALAVLVGLGWWQWSRHLSRQDLEASFARRIAAEPLGEAAPATPLPDLDFQRVALEGSWEHEQAMTLINRVRGTRRGEELVEPLRLADGRAVLVNRGWYPVEEREAVRAALFADLEGEAAGIARLEPGRGRRGDDGGWTAFDVARMASSVPGAIEDWGVIAGEQVEGAASSAPPFPVTGWRAYESTVPHVQYALTWWALAAALLVTVAARFGPLARRRAGRSSGEGEDSAAL